MCLIDPRGLRPGEKKPKPRVHLGLLGVAGLLPTFPTSSLLPFHCAPLLWDAATLRRQLFPGILARAAQEAWVCIWNGGGLLCDPRQTP